MGEQADEGIFLHNAVQMKKKKPSDIIKVSSLSDEKACMLSNRDKPIRLVWDSI